VKSASITIKPAKGRNSRADYSTHHLKFLRGDLKTSLRYNLRFSSWRRVADLLYYLAVDFEGGDGWHAEHEQRLLAC
jgi:hypothetical protein